VKYEEFFSQKKCREKITWETWAKMGGCRDKIGVEGDDVVRQTHVRLHWWALVSAVMNCGFHKRRQFLYELSDCQLLEDCAALS
jgi:hypothetical protein